MTFGRKPFAHISYFQSEEEIQAEREEPMTTPSDTPRIHLDPDDFGCPYCGAIAGACSNYPNCPGNGRIDAPAAGQEAKFLSPEARIVQLERELVAAQERIRTVEVECDDAVSALNMTGNEAQKELHRVVTEFARYRERAESALAQEREARRAAEKDAERYRWLLKQVSHNDFIPIAQVVWKQLSNPHGEWVNLINGADLDAHIDAQLAAIAGTK